MSVLVGIAIAGNIDTRGVPVFGRCGPIPRTAAAIFARAFLETDHSHLLFIDSDVVPPVNCLELMLAMDHPLVCGINPLQLEEDLCTSVAQKFAPHTYGFLKDFPDEPFEIDAAGLGCCLIAREVLGLFQEHRAGARQAGMMQTA